MSKPQCKEHVRIGAWVIYCDRNPRDGHGIHGASLGNRALLTWLEGAQPWERVETKG